MAFRREALARDRRLRPALPRSGRRRGRVLAPAAARWPDRFSCRRDGLAPPAQFAHDVLAATEGYGKAEALLEEKWPERYDRAGHLAWAGRLYGRGFTVPIPHGMARVYGGVWGSAAYQSLYQPAPLTLLMFPLMPEWYLVIAALAALSLLGLSWPPLASAFPLFLLAAAAPVVQAAHGCGARDVSGAGKIRTRRGRATAAHRLPASHATARAADRAHAARADAVAATMRRGCRSSSSRT